MMSSTQCSLLLTSNHHHFISIVTWYLGKTWKSLFGKFLASSNLHNLRFCHLRSLLDSTGCGPAWFCCCYTLHIYSCTFALGELRGIKMPLCSRPSKVKLNFFYSRGISTNCTISLASQQRWMCWFSTTTVSRHHPKMWSYLWPQNQLPE